MAATRELLRRYDLRLIKRLGQNLLIDEGALARIVAAAELAPTETVLEVGPGLGTLTRALAEQAARVVAVEIDRRMVQVLQTELGHLPNINVVHGDILALDPKTLVEGEPYKVVANLPYAITSAVLRHLLEAALPPQRTVVTVQREVAERIVARDGRMSLLAVSIHFYGRPQILFRLKPGAFYPAPQVTSAVIRIDPHETPPVLVDDTDRFFRVVRAGFSQPRKQLHNSLAASLHLDRQAVAAALRGAGIDPRVRAERLGLTDWARAMHALEPLLAGISPSHT